MLRKGQSIVKVVGVAELVRNFPESDILGGITSGGVYMPTYRHSRSRRYDYFPDLLAARRGLAHIFMNYFGKEDLPPAEVKKIFSRKGFSQGEVAELTKVIGEIRSLVQELDQNPPPQERETAESELLHLGGMLAGKHDQYKVRAATRLKRAAQHKKPGGLPAQEASATGAANDLERRINRIMEISPQLWRRKLILDNEAAYIESELQKVLGILLGIERGARNKKVVLAVHVVPERTASFSFAVKPYRGQLAKVVFHLFRAISAKDEEKTSKALDLAINCLCEVIARLRRLKI